MAHAKRKARVQTSVIRKELRYPKGFLGPFNPVSYYGSMTITDAIVRAGRTRDLFPGKYVYQFPRWNFLQGRAEGAL